MNPDAILSGRDGLSGIQSVLIGRTSRRMLRHELQSMLNPGHKIGPLHLTRAKYKPGRKLSAYFTTPTIDSAGQALKGVSIAVDWEPNPDGSAQKSQRDDLVEEAATAGLLNVPCELWKEIPSQGATIQLWPLDLEFPHLVHLVDQAYVTRLLAALGLYEDQGVNLSITPVRYRPGERHVLRYEISQSEMGAGKYIRLYAKLYTTSQAAARAFGIASRVSDWLAANPQPMLGNKPRALSLDDCVILYPHAPGTPLSHQLSRSRQWLSTQLRTIGQALFILHTGPDELKNGLKQNTFANEMKLVQRACEHIQILLPEAFTAIQRILEQLEYRYRKLPQEEPTFTHSDFKADHLLTTPQGLTLIDFDTCTLTDPAMDLGKFLADLEWWFSLQKISGVEEAQSELVKGYVWLSGTGSIIESRIARARLYQVLIYMKIIARRMPLYRKDWASLTSRGIQKADQLLGEPLKAF